MPDIDRNSSTMYAIIFKAQILQLDADYYALADRLRQRVLAEYDCIEMLSVCEDDMEVTVSYWTSLDTIRRWKRDELHQQAQKQANARWYKSYRVQVCEIIG